ncbi:MAG: IS200/IS605 family transposase [Verrucomicrobia bacterium]|nr:IS200/IS605 family transposase [Verrucomicrobiota bacterium]
MANTYTQIYIHIVFAVQGRQNLLRREYNDELQKYMTGIISRQGQKLIAINNMPDHFHILIGQRPNVALSDLVRNIKAGSSGFINDRRWVAGRFSWQEGFGAFSYSHSQLNTVIRYVQNQQAHHRRKSFNEEYIELLKRFNVPHDQRYIFKPVEPD